MVGTSSFMGESKIQNLYFIIPPYLQLENSCNLYNKIIRKSTVPKLNLALDLTSQTDFEGVKPHRERADDELSAEFLPVHNVSAYR